MKRLFIALLGLIHTLSATEYTPWYGRSLQLEGRLTQSFQQYNALNIQSQSIKKKGLNSFSDFSLMVPFDVYCAEFELIAVDTWQRNYCVDCIKLTGRYMWLDQDIGDLINLTMGLTATQTFGKAINDIATYHPGKIAADFHVAVGKSWDLCSGWEMRGWGFVGIGNADNGPAWTFGKAALDFRSDYGNIFRAFADWHYAFGGDNFCHLRDIPQAKRHFLDLGIRYTRRFDNFFELSLEYSYRTWVKNGFANANIFVFQIMYPFGI